MMKMQFRKLSSSNDNEAMKQIVWGRCGFSPLEVFKMRLDKHLSGITTQTQLQLGNIIVMHCFFLRLQSVPSHNLSLLLINAISVFLFAYSTVIKRQMSFHISCCCWIVPLLHCIASAGSSMVSLEVKSVWTVLCQITQVSSKGTGNNE